MSARNLDKHNRFRCITVGFRVSPEEHEHINKAVALSLKGRTLGFVA